MNRILDSKNSNKFYLPLAVVVFACTVMLNFYIKIADCALVFTFLVIALNTIAALYGIRKAMSTIILSVSVSLALLWNLKYYIHGQVINSLVITSLLSVLASSYIGLNIFSRLEGRYNFYVRSFLSLISYAIADGTIMALFFINIFSLDRALQIFTREVGHKCFYGLIAYGSLLTVSYLQKQFSAMKN